MNALHNHALIRRAIPQSLHQWPVFFPDRQAHRNTAAATLRDKHLQKKLANEAAKRKKAEDARKVVSVGLVDTSHANTSEVNELEAAEDSNVSGDELDDGVRDHVSSEFTGLLNEDDELDAELNSTEGQFVVTIPRPKPRGPRGRRGQGRGRGRGGSSRGSGHVISSAGLSNGKRPRIDDV